MIINSKFKPHRWLGNPHLQTVVASKFQPPSPPAYEAERLELPDGDYVDLAWNLENDGPLVCVFHGLQGSIKSAYAARVLQRLKCDGFRTVFMHFRGCSGEPNRMACGYHSGHTDDIRYLIKTISKRYPKTPLFAVAYSLGANALLKYLGEEQENCLLQQSIAVSPPLLLAEGAKRMNRGLSRLYQSWLVRQMQQAILDKKNTYPKLNLPEDVKQYNSFWRFDNYVTAPINGFKDVNDYYKQASSLPWLINIRAPSHILFARDDPFFTEKVIPTEKQLSDSVIFELTEKGGHVGFIGENGDGGLCYWLDCRISEIFRQTTLSN